jgi:hypothetical protein
MRLRREAPRVTKEWKKAKCIMNNEKVFLGTLFGFFPFSFSIDPLDVMTIRCAMTSLNTTM